MNKLSETIIAAIEDKKGQSIVSLDLRGFDGAVCDEFIVCNADSGTQVLSIATSRMANQKRGYRKCSVGDCRLWRCRRTYL